MNNVSVYVWAPTFKKWYWVRTFYANNYKNERGAYKAALRWAKIKATETGNTYRTIENED